MKWLAGVLLLAAACVGAQTPDSQQRQTNFARASMKYEGCVTTYARRYAKVQATPTEIATAAVDACTLELSDTVRTAGEASTKYDWDAAKESGHARAIRAVIEARADTMK